MSKIEVRGIITPSYYDAEFFYSYIQRGVLTPESYFRKMLDSAAKTEPLEVYINSQGGSVFAGSEMINALNCWKLENRQPVNMTVGAIAASMAAAMLVFAADKVTVHSNSKLMFHGAQTGTEGGEGAHQDASDLLKKINAELKTVLISRYKLTPEQVETWFAEGRMGWLSAAEAKAIGLANEIIGTEDAENKDAAIVFKNMTEQGMKLAACLENINNKNEDENMTFEKIKNWFTGKGLPENSEDEKLDEFLGTLKTSKDVESAYDEGKLAGITQGKAEQSALNQAFTKEAEDKLKEFSSAMAAKDVEIVNLKKTADEMTARNEKLTAGLQAPSGDAPVGRKGFFMMVESLVAEGMDKEAALIKVQRENPELHRQMLAESNKK
jgi:ATP-dependent protease ClpP protease subunit